jgi:hypothetical protein
VLSRDPLFLEGVARFEGARYWDAHESWETLWRAADDDAQRRLLQGLIQVAAGLHHLSVRGDRDACLRLLARGRSKLDGLAEVVGGVDVGVVREGAERCVEAVEAGRCGPTDVPRIGPARVG